MKNYPHSRAPLALRKKRAFSLIEMLMALLVASLLMAAMAPVMIKKSRENVSLTGEVNAPKLKKHEINYNDENCKTTNDANNTCEGQFTIPSGFNGSLYVTLMGGGGGGASAPTTGSIEYTSAGNQTFIVPKGVYEIEVTLVSGGAGGGPGNLGLDTPAAQDFIGSNTETSQDRIWTIPVALKGKYAIVEACAGGGGAGGGGGSNRFNTLQGGGGGAGEYNKIAQLIPPAASLYVRIGGGGASGGGNWATVAGAFGGLCGGGGGAAYEPGGCGGGRAGAAGVLNTRGSICTENNATGGTAAGGTGGLAGVAKYAGGRGGTYCGGGGGTGVGYDVAVEIDNLSGIMRHTGGGAGGGGATVVSVNSNFSSPYLNLVGGGGGSSGARGDVDLAFFSNAAMRMVGGGGGGGGGPAVGNDGKGADLVNNDPTGRTGFSGDGTGGNVVSRLGLTIATPWASNCNGGSSTVAASPVSTAGFPGAARVTYFDYNKGGNSGGAGKALVKQRIKVTPGETLTITVGDGGVGGNAPYINSSGTVIASTSAYFGTKSVLYRGTTTGTILMDTGQSNASSIVSTDTMGKQGQSSPVAELQAACTPGTGVTAGNHSVAASGYGGCGGGGGGALGNGSKGAPGYAKITWNPDKLGNGGGGASGNYLKKQLITVASGLTVKYQIGAGGKQGSASNTTLDGSSGGATIFGTSSSPTNFNIQVGGGYGGKSSTYNSITNKTENGIGGFKADICKMASTPLICTGSTNGGSGTNTRGGKGANSDLGIGPDGSTNGTADDAAELGTGGAGASVVDLGLTSTPSTSTAKGGKGANGKLILEWYE